MSGEISNVFIGILSFIGTLIGTLGGILAANKLSNYRIGELEKKVEKHNNLIEQMAKTERDIKTLYRLVDEQKDSNTDIRKEVKDEISDLREEVQEVRNDVSEINVAIGEIKTKISSY